MDRNVQTNTPPRDRTEWREASETLTMAFNNGWPSSEILDRLLDGIETHTSWGQSR